MFTVVWTPSSEDELARIWLVAAEFRGVISAASRRLDGEIRARPLHFGESRERGVRIAHPPPLGIFYTVSSEDRLVRVVSVWLYLPRSKR